MKDFWTRLRDRTQARIGQDRTGDTVTSDEVLAFREAHARARDAVHVPLDVDTLVPAVRALGLGAPITVTSAASSRPEYLRRPDLGRRLSAQSSVPAQDADLGIVLADGLSTTAVSRHAAPMLAALLEAFEHRLNFATPVIATNARVALSDEIGERLGVTTVLVLIGERPGLTVDDSLSIYLTYRPRIGLTDADRNCVSNIHPPEGLGYDAAARKIRALVEGARLLGASGVRLKDTSDALPDGLRDTLPPA